MTEVTEGEGLEDMSGAKRRYAVKEYERRGCLNLRGGSSVRVAFRPV